MYRQLTAALRRVLPESALFKHGFNLSPMYRRSTGRVTRVSDDLHEVEVAIPLSWRNANYVGTMFGGSLLSATDPILMIQLLHILGDGYVVWDKAVQMRFRRPARSRVTARFVFTSEEIEAIRSAADDHGETDWDKPVELVDEAGQVVAHGTKTLYVATKAFRRAKDAQRSAVQKRASAG
ncbi:DUF4442 domain-containing protein [Rubrivirga sp. IMCC45206]|uniref:DUF4442 domain-containing protein n=1 Tax=Rubrivirga sp. IMCC45206 TaxID=3391614 RepID=UPI003990271B